MDWGDIKVFLAIARAGTLGGAARAIGLTQPTMGRRLRALEAAVGQKLFQPNSEGFMLTAEGAAVLIHAERIEEEALAIERQLAGQEQGLEGVVRVSSSDWFGVHVLSPVFAEFALAHRHVTVELITDARLYSLARREADVAFRIRPFDDTGVIQRRLMTVSYGLYAHRSLPTSGLGQGEGKSLITLDAAYSDFPDMRWLATNLPRAHVAVRSNSREVQAQMCAAGVGLAVLPKMLGESTADLVEVVLETTPPGRDVWLGFHRDLKHLARMRALVDLTVSRLAN